MSKNKNRRSQTAKTLTGGRNQAFNEAMMEIGRSNATAPRRQATDYRRKPKHVKNGWDD